jgi:DNA-binding IclR family transcriptional regulator
MSFDAMRQVMALDLPCTEKMVLLVLADFHNSKSERCNPEKTTIAKVAGLSKRSADRAIAQLKDRGLIEIRSTNGRYSNGYTLQLLHGSTLSELHG